jgi:LasA protease
VDSAAWVVASAPGVIARSELGAVALDLDGEDGTAADGLEQTGWVVVYLHLAEVDRVSMGVRVQADEKLGHPSCEGGISTGTHVHLVRKYNGEWIPADGSLPFVLDGWTAHNGSETYKGTLTRNNEIVTANLYGMYESRIIRDK